ncbi:cyclin-domain-containing protein [Absidia repens]|uniref:Cyclin-domain-containing protein n=1 Tax=Absidia repens TaxID=90262 RepID=A0A1X2IAV3_9FUNG|nr:cyclin-domain-containing protein [Absidia repens]
MESPSTFHFDLGVHPTKDTIKLITSLLEKVISVNDTIHTAAANVKSNESTTTTATTTTTTTTEVTATQLKADEQQKSDDTSNQRSSRHMSSPNIYTCFHARSIPSISIQAYLNRILKYCPCTNECFLAILVYFDRMAKPDPPARPVPLRIDSYNVHRLIIAGVMIASKLFSDVFFTNTRYAKVGGLPVSELNVLEVEFLALNEYNLFVTVEEFQYYGDQLLIHWMKEHEGGNGMTSSTSWENSKPVGSSPQNDTTKNKDNDVIMTDRTTNTRSAESTEQEYDTAQMNRATRQLSIDKNRPSPGMTRSTTSTTTPMKDINRKSDEIDQHRLFKRPSSRAVGDIQDHISRTHIANNSIHTPSTTITTNSFISNNNGNDNGQHDSSSSSEQHQ